MLPEALSPKPRHWILRGREPGLDSSDTPEDEPEPYERCCRLRGLKGVKGDYVD